MYPRSITPQNSQTTLKTLFKSRYLFLVFLLSANAAAIAAEVPDLGVEQSVSTEPHSTPEIPSG